MHTPGPLKKVEGEVRWCEPRSQKPMDARQHCGSIPPPSAMIGTNYRLILILDRPDKSHNYALESVFIRRWYRLVQSAKSPLITHLSPYVEVGLYHLYIDELLHPCYILSNNPVTTGVG